MKTEISLKRIALALVPALIVIGAAAWYGGVIGLSRIRPPANAIMVLCPYRDSGTWVFDDLRAGLRREPFVAGVPEMIDFLVKDMPEAEKGFRLLFSARPFPGHQEKLTWVRAESGGNYYRLDEPPMEGWLCPAMFKYFAEPPKEIHVKAEPKE